MSPRLPLLAMVGLLLPFLAGCRRDEIRHYQAAKEPAIAPHAHGMENSSPATLPDGHPPLTAENKTGDSQAPSDGGRRAGSALVWSAPGKWEAGPKSQMRHGSYTLRDADGKEADLSIFVFPGSAGGFADNINRWRGQVGLPALSLAEIQSTAVQVKTETGLDLVVVDLLGPSGDRIAGAILETGAESWFFKLRGPDALITQRKAEFLAFLKTVRQP